MASESLKSGDPNFVAKKAKQREVIATKTTSLIVITTGLAITVMSAFMAEDAYLDGTEHPPSAILEPAQDMVKDYEIRFGTPRGHAFGKTSSPRAEDANNLELQKAYGILDQEAEADVDTFNKESSVVTGIAGILFVGMGTILYPRKESEGRKS